VSRGSKLTNEERIAAVQEYQDGKGSYRAIGEKYGVSDYVIRTLVNRAKSDGIDFVKVSRTNKKYLIPQNSNRFCNSKEGTNPAVTATKRQA
jgi:transposase